MHNADEGERIPSVFENQGGAPRVESAALFKGTREIVIEHNGELYRLRITRQGKLILNK